jgi:hypothetical protein
MRNSESRNAKTNSNVQKRRKLETVDIAEWDLPFNTLPLSNFGFVSDFDIRVSKLNRHLEFFSDFDRMEEDMHMSTRCLHTITLLFCAIGLAACGLGKPLPPLGSYAHQLSDGNVTLYWDCSRPEPGVVRVAGWANNPYYPQPIKDLGFTLYGENAQGSDISSAQAYAQSYTIFTMDPTPFTINLQTAGGEVQYQLFYHYYFSGDREANVGLSDYWHNMANNVCAGLAP